MISGPLVIVFVLILMLGVVWLVEFVDAVKATRRDEQALREYLRRMEQREESSLIDDSPSPLPDEWRKPADVVPFPTDRTSGNAA